MVIMLLFIVDGGWSDWSTWNDCSVECGKGETSRTRECVNPAPQYGGNLCQMDGSKDTEMQTCYRTPCTSNFFSNLCTPRRLIRILYILLESLVGTFYSRSLLFGDERKHKL